MAKAAAQPYLNALPWVKMARTCQAVNMPFGAIARHRWMSPLVLRYLGDETCAKLLTLLDIVNHVLVLCLRGQYTWCLREV